MLAGVLAYAGACSDSAVPAIAPRQNPATPTLPPPPNDASVSFSPSNAGVLADDSLSMGGFVYRGRGAGSDTLDWSVDDTTLASIQVVGLNRIMIHPRRAGWLTVSARTRGALPLLAASTSIKILTPSAQPAPIDVAEFRVVEYWYQAAAQWRYAPQLALQAIGQDSVGIVSVRLEIPEIAPSVFCWTDRLVGKTFKPVFAPLGDGNMTDFFESGHRAPQAALAVATIAVLLNDGTGARLVVKRQIESNNVLRGYNEAPGDWLSCN